MKPEVKEFKDDLALKEEIDKLNEKGVSKDNLFIMSHDDDHTDRVADSIEAGKLGEGFKTEKGKVFNRKGDELREQFKELGFNQEEAEDFEEQLDRGSILLINTSEK